MVQIQSPVWTMKMSCPVCQQGSCLVFLCCPNCGQLAVRCQEDGNIFLKPRDLGSLTGADPATIQCPGCRSGTLAGFRAATDQEIRAAGFTPGEYES